MNIKKLAAILTAAMMCVMMTGCAVETAGTDTAAASAVPTPSPTPTPEPKEGLEAVFDKETLTMALVSDADETASELFFEGATREAESMGITVTKDAAGSGFDAAVTDAAGTADALVVLITDEATDTSAVADAADAGLPVCVFQMSKGDVPDGVSHLYYEDDGALDMTFNAALVYPPHDTPVRLILLFESADSPGYAAYQALYDQGMIFPKGIYIASDAETSPGEWLTGVLDNYVEGMLDGVFAEDATLAVGAYDALNALERTDMEVFCPGITPDVVTRMQKDPEVFAQAVGANTPLAGVLSVRAALSMLYGEEPVTQAFSPALADASGFGDDAVAALMTADSEMAALYDTDWMDTLRAYYGTEETAETK